MQPIDERKTKKTPLLRPIRTDEGPAPLDDQEWELLLRWVESQLGATRRSDDVSQASDSET